MSITYPCCYLVCLALLLCAAPIATLTAAEELPHTPSGKTDDSEDSDDSDDYPDIVFLANGQRMQVLLETLPDAHSRVVSLHTPGGGLITLDSALIAEIRPGLNYRLQHYNRNDTPEMLGLARFCLAAGRKKEALSILRTAHARSTLAAAHLRSLAQLVDQFEGPKKALPLYKTYRANGGKDAATLIRLEILEHAIAKHQADIEKIFADNPQFRTISEGLEKKKTWRSENVKWANPITISTRSIDMGAQRSNTILQVDYTGGSQSKAAVVVQTNIDARQQDQLTFYISNPADRPLRIAIAVKCGSRWTYFESRSISVPAQAIWETCTFDLHRADFKSQASNWTHKATIDQLHAIREIQILIHNGSNDGTLMIDGIGFGAKQTDF